MLLDMSKTLNLFYYFNQYISHASTVNSRVWSD